jgi:integrase
VAGAWPRIRFLSRHTTQREQCPAVIPGILRKAALAAEDWTPREMRHSFVSLLSDSGVPVEQIARLVGHAGGSQVTETVYLKQIRPVLLEGAEAMDSIFGGPAAA